MLGHQLVQSLSSVHIVHATFRGNRETRQLPGVHHFAVDARDFSRVEEVVTSVDPDVIVNSIGIVKQRADADDAVLSIEINSLFPHKVAALAGRHGARFITLSTDCVFSGRRGMYSEDDVPDATDLYGRSKLLGEVYGANGLTLRSSIVGLEMTRKRSLVEWFLAQQDEINGYARAIYSGLTTVEMARVIERCALSSQNPTGLYHVSSDPISKFDLLCGLRDRLGLDIRIRRDEQFANDKSLNSARFRRELRYDPPSWDTMLDELADQIRERQK